MTRRRTPTLIATAYHEAGHAVQALAEGLPVRHATIRPEGEVHGHVHYGAATPLYRGELRLRTAERRGRTALAGMVAQRIHSPASLRRYQASSDREAAADLAMHVSGSTAIAEARLALWMAETEASMRRRWAAVERVALALVDRTTLDGPELRALAMPAKLGKA